MLSVVIVVQLLSVQFIWMRLFVVVVVQLLSVQFVRLRLFVQFVRMLFVVVFVVLRRRMRRRFLLPTGLFAVVFVVCTDRLSGRMSPKLLSPLDRNIKINFNLNRYVIPVKIMPTTTTTITTTGTDGAVFGELGGRPNGKPPVRNAAIGKPSKPMQPVPMTRIVLPSGAVLEIIPAADAGPLAELFLASLRN